MLKAGAITSQEECLNVDYFFKMVPKESRPGEGLFDCGHFDNVGNCKCTGMMEATKSKNRDKRVCKGESFQKHTFEEA
jgi:hypothetical protein